MSDHDWRTYEYWKAVFCDRWQPPREEPAVESQSEPAMPIDELVKLLRDQANLQRFHHGNDYVIGAILGEAADRIIEQRRSRAALSEKKAEHRRRLEWMAHYAGET